MMRLVRILPDEDLIFIYDGDKFVAFTYPLGVGRPNPVWAVSGARKPFAANIDDFASFEAVLDFVKAHWYVQ